MARPRDDGKPADDALPPDGPVAGVGDGGESGQSIKPAMSTEDLLTAGVAVDVPYETPNAGSGLRYFDDSDTEVPPEWQPEALFKNGNEAWTAVAAGNMDSSAAAAAQGDGPEGEGGAAPPDEGNPPEPPAPPEKPADGPGKPAPAAEKPVPPAAKK